LLDSGVLHAAPPSQRTCRCVSGGVPSAVVGFRSTCSRKSCAETLFVRERGLRAREALSMLAPVSRSPCRVARPRRRDRACSACGHPLRAASAAAPIRHPRSGLDDTPRRRPPKANRSRSTHGLLDLSGPRSRAGLSRERALASALASGCEHPWLRRGGPAGSTARRIGSPAARGLERMPCEVSY
jgi:hypothetical protein